MSDGGTDQRLIERYVPDFVARRLAGSAEPIALPSCERRSAVVVFVDISGFTPLTERLARRGAAGAEEMATILNRYLNPLVEHILDGGGTIVDFAGDALLALWPAPGELETPCRHATRCALGLHALAADLANDDVALSLKTSVSAGRIAEMHVGTALRRYCLVGGSAQRQVTAADKLASPGSVVASAAVAAHLGGQFTQLGSGFVRVDSVGPAPEVVLAPAIPVREELEGLLRDYLPVAVRARVEAGQSEWLSEFRRVTSLFINVVGLDYETDREVRHLQAMTTDIEAAAERFDGRLQQFMVDDKGTVILIAFGLPPRAYEDDPLRAMSAALAIEEAIAQHGGRSAMGIGTGNVFVGPIGGERRRQYTVIGDSINRAARLMQHALDDILCDAATAETLDGACLEALEPIELKGKAAPVAVFRPRGPVKPAPPRRRDDSRITGRRAELDALRGALTRLLEEGRGGSCVVEGEAGIGKSRLLSAFSREAADRGVDVLSVVGDAIEQTTPFVSFQPVLERMLAMAAAGPDPAARRRHLTRRLRAHERWLAHAPLLGPVLGILCAESDVTAALTGERRAAATRAFLVELLRTLQGGTPTLVAVEDAHWLDAASFALLEDLCADAPELMIVATCRPVRGNAAYERLKTASRAHLHLEPMSSAEVVQLACQHLGVRELPTAVEDLIASRAGGNPFFSEEIAHSLVESGQVETDGGRGVIAGDLGRRELRLPDTVQGVVTSRIDALRQDLQLAVKVASVIATVVDEETLRGLLGEQVASPSSQLEELTALGILKSTDRAGSYAFRHAITRDVVYSSIPFSRRRELHQRIARWLEASGATAPTTLAHHWSEAAGDPGGDPSTAERAWRSLEAAGRAALAVGMTAEAMTLLQRADAYFRGLPTGHRDPLSELGLVKALGTATFTTSGYGSPEAVSVWERAMGLLADDTAAHERFEVLWGLWIAYHFAKATDEALRLGDAMLSLAQGLDDAELLLQAHHSLWTTYASMPDYARAREHLEAGIALYQPEWQASHCVRFGGHDPGACAHRAVGLVSCAVGRVDHAVEAAIRGVEVARPHPYSCATCMLALAFIHYQRGDFEQTADAAQQLVDYCEEHSFPGLAPWGEFLIQWSHGKRGALNEAIEHMSGLEDALGMLDPGYMCALLELYVEARDVDAGESLVERLLEVVAAKAEHAFEPELYRYRGELAYAAGRFDDASADFEQAIRIARAQGARNFELRAATSRARCVGGEDARAALGSLVASFTEGAEARDLRVAMQVLGRPAAPPQ